jgi:hypothetical protein
MKRAKSSVGRFVGEVSGILLKDLSNKQGSILPSQNACILTNHRRIISEQRYKELKNFNKDIN